MSTIITFVKRLVRTFTRGNNRRVNRIILHHWVAVWTNVQTQNFLNNNGVSYHVGNDRNAENAQFVQFGDIAWHAGSANGDSIGVGVSNSQMASPWPVSQQTLDMLPRVLAHLSRVHNLGELVRGRNFFLHRDVGNTSCPGPFLTERIPQILAEANRLIRGDVATPPQQPPAQPGALWRVQVGAFKSTANANATLTLAKDRGFRDAFIKRSSVDLLHRVQLGAFAVEANAERRLQEARNAGFRDAFIRRD